MTDLQSRIIACLHGDPYQTYADLASQLDVVPTDIQCAMAGLMRDGLVEFDFTPTMVLTDKGEAEVGRGQQRLQWWRVAS